MKQITRLTEEMIRRVASELYVVAEEDVEDLVVAIEREEKLDSEQSDIVENLIYSANLNHECFPQLGYDGVVEELRLALDK